MISLFRNGRPVTCQSFDSLFWNLDGHMQRLVDMALSGPKEERFYLRPDDVDFAVQSIPKIRRTQRKSLRMRKPVLVPNGMSVDKNLGEAFAMLATSLSSVGSVRLAYRKEKMFMTMPPPEPVTVKWGEIDLCAHYQPADAAVPLVNLLPEIGYSHDGLALLWFLGFNPYLAEMIGGIAGYHETDRTPETEVEIPILLLNGIFSESRDAIYGLRREERWLVLESFPLNESFPGVSAPRLTASEG